MAIEIKNLQKVLPVQPAHFLAPIRKILTSEGVPHGQLSVVFVTDRRIRAINKEFLGRDETTDVIAFDLRPVVERKKKTGKGVALDGEIVICTQRARQNARRFGVTTREELLLLIAHGIAHLLGYDDHSPRDCQRMREKENQLMALVNSKPRVASRHQSRRGA